MAAGFVVPGPTVIKIDTNILGYTDNDDLISIDFEDFNEILTSTDNGDEPAEIVYRGRIAIITANLVKWDTAQAVLMQQPPGATGGEGDAGVIGSQWIAGNHHWEVAIEPITSGKFGYTFDRCIVNGANSVQFSDFGNTHQRLRVQFLAFRTHGTDTTVGDGSDATIKLYTRAVIA